MKKIICLLAVVVLATHAVESAVAQESGLFSGFGYKDGFGTKEASNSKTGSTAFSFYKSNKDQKGDSEKTSGFQFPKLELPKLKAPNWELPKLFQGDKFPSPVQLSDKESKGIFSGFSKWKSDSNQPNFFQRMNERTKQAFGRTRDSISNLAGGNALGLDKTSSGSWDRITRGLNGDIGGSGNRNQPPVQPNLRSARQTTEDSAKRY